MAAVRSAALVYVNPILRDDLVLEHYQKEESWVEVLESGPQMEMDRLKYSYGPGYSPALPQWKKNTGCWSRHGSVRQTGS